MEEPIAIPKANDTPTKLKQFSGGKSLKRVQETNIPHAVRRTKKGIEIIEKKIISIPRPLSVTKSIQIPDVTQKMVTDIEKIEMIEDMVTTAPTDSLYNFFSNGLMSLMDPTFVGMRFTQEEILMYLDTNYRNYNTIQFPRSKINSEIPINTDWDTKDEDYSPKETNSSLPYKVEVDLKGTDYPFHDGKWKNPFGRTGISGLGEFTKWGPNEVNYLLISTFHPSHGPIMLLQKTKEWTFINSVKIMMEQAKRNGFHPEKLQKMIDDKKKPIASVPQCDHRNTDDAWFQLTIHHVKFDCKEFFPVFTQYPSEPEFKWVPMSGYITETSEMNGTHLDLLREFNATFLLH
jgi:hypothetical protein